MSPIREKFVKVIESLPYNIDEEVLKKSTKEILQEVAREICWHIWYWWFIWKWQRMYKIINLETKFN